MHPFFSPLSEFELGLLLTTLTVGGSEQVALFSALPTDSQARVGDRAQALLQIPPDKRVPLMVRELKNALEVNGLHGVERMDPSWIVHGLKGESAQVVALILVSLPAPVTRSVLRRLPQHVRRDLPPKQVIRDIHPAIAQGVRLLFEARFAPMPSPPLGPVGFLDLVHLERQELVDLTRDLGLIELGQAFVSVGKMALLELCRRLPRGDAEELVQAVRAASHVDVPDPKTAQHFLSRVVMNFENTEEFLQRAGLWRLAKATLSCPETFRRAFAQRLPRRAAKILSQFQERTEDMGIMDEAAQHRLQDSILVRVAWLCQSGVMTGNFSSATFTYHDGAASQTALVEAAKGLSPQGAANPEEAQQTLGELEAPPHDPKPNT